MKSILSVAMLLVLLAAQVSAQTVSRIAAIVNDEIITTYQLQQAATEAGQELSNEQLAGRDNPVLQKLIDDLLLSQRIKELGLTVSEEELDAAITDVQRQNNLTREQLIDALSAQGMPFATYQNNLRDEILRYKLIGREVNSQIEVTNKQVRAYFREHIDDYRVPPKIHLQRISFKLPPANTEQQLEAVRELAATVYDQLTVERQPYEEVLASLGNAAEGVDMDFFEEADLLPVIQQAVKNLEPGQVTEPIEVGEQIHLFQVADYAPGDSTLFDRVSPEIRDILKKQNTEKRFQEWSRELRDQAYIKILL